MRLENRVAIVTGGAQGIGKAIAAAFVDEGAHVLIHVEPEGEAKSRGALILN